MIVKKFGGSSLQDALHITKVFDLVEEARSDDTVVVVLSAMKGVTDQLEHASTVAAYAGDDDDKAHSTHYDAIVHTHRLAWEGICSYANDSAPFPSDIVSLLDDLKEVLLGIALVKECTAQTLDLVMSFGERLSATLFTQGYNLCKSPDARYIDARGCIITDGTGHVTYKESYEKLCKQLTSVDGVAILTGYIASNPEGVTTTLGRDGSDYTAALAGVAVNAERIEIWTDVDGILSADPRIVPEAFVVPRISYAEAMELSYFGAKVMYPPSFVPATEHNIPIVIRNTTNPSAKGTWIVAESEVEEDSITGIALLRGVSLITIEGAGLYGNFYYLPKIFEILSTHHIRPIMISQASSEHSICFALMTSEAQRTASHLKEQFRTELNQKTIQSVQLLDDISIVSVIGSRMKGYVGIAGRIFSVIGKNTINIIAIAQGSSELNISFAVEASRDQEAVQRLHCEFFSSGHNTP